MHTFMLVAGILAGIAALIVGVPVIMIWIASARGENPFQ